ncbi:MAG: hypothetical protein FWD61_11065 [Phycisphaerales bacterium]|nr:hypothetical protein [Phycisphaerales bacterium]
MEEVGLLELKRVKGGLGVRGMTLLVAGVLVVSFLAQLPTYRVADWAEFAFYDAGTVIKGDMLVAKGYVPTVDFGYTHGLLSLLYGRVGFAVFGRGAWGYLGLMVLGEMGMAWGLARVLVAMRVRRAGVVLFCVGLPLAVMPAYLTLTHVLEGMCITMALAEQAEGKRSRALGWMVVCVMVKPSMGYVYGFWLVGVHALASLSRRKRNTLKCELRFVLPAVIVGGVLVVGLSMWMGVGTVVATMLPTTGMKTYAAAGFGFFGEQGRAFWMPGDAWKYVISPVGAFLLAAVVSAGGAGWAGWGILRRLATDSHGQTQTMLRRMEMMVTVGVLHTAFLLGFYGWTGSWNYYSYLAVLGLVMGVDSATPQSGVATTWRRGIVGAVVVVMLLSQVETAGAVWNGWKWKQRMDGLWVERDLQAEWEGVMKRVGEGRTIVMTNGWIAGNVELPDAWFPELGIPTESELERVRRQVEKVEFVVRWKAYQKFEDVWNARELDAEREQFKTIWMGRFLELMKRNGGEGEEEVKSKR